MNHHGVQTSTSDMKQRERSSDYIKHTRFLVELAEKELISPEGSVISAAGLKKVRMKLESITQG